jgi:hypothetical protein
MTNVLINALWNIVKRQRALDVAISDNPELTGHFNLCSLSNDYNEQRTIDGHFMHQRAG